MKNLLLFAFVALSFSANAQFTVWEDDFNDGNITDWTVWDLNGDEHKWQVNKNVQVGESGAIDLTTGTHNVLAVYAFDFETNEFFPNPDFEWTVSPAIDLSFYTGVTELVINTQKMIYDGASDLYIYGSISPEKESFVVLDTIHIHRDPQADLDTHFSDYTIDISQYAGKEQFYFAIVTDQFALYAGHEIDNVKITATEVVTGIDDVTKTATKIKQNPVSETLQLQLSTAIDAEALNVQIYNTSGMLVKDGRYTESGISVSDLSSGLYFLKLSNGTVTERIKFIKK
ncbi:T9SS type A sorting domain-containing protein [Flavobacterium cerinum]|uniref:T9SS type A sorting domain-containing protein n=1 Tax=Flavobacterium cerinum TaxID=2502784 RepID=A0A444GLB9_9FLAO|nr:T9SS type A sorting domain-containing protein [Flavobacterium cerinum]RWW91716.1 T9SS type A sorting domain-containing protein [Flavobacterium cerinum]